MNTSSPRFNVPTRRPICAACVIVWIVAPAIVPCLLLWIYWSLK